MRPFDVVDRESHSMVIGVGTLANVSDGSMSNVSPHPWEKNLRWLGPLERAKPANRSLGWIMEIR
jgi:hypothetical protein